ncbi:GNAT family N-acetyltransferase [Nonomuraea sp. NPDC050790]|uniref:GNAT family N-acetyltransferase n=1 Tax=Nonomuraea sp. NPDC050790 TaxID=3364371 RepID=UPI00378C610B
MTDLELLRHEMRVCWDIDEHDRIRGVSEDLAVAVARDGTMAAAVSETLPEQTAKALLDRLASTPPPSEGRPPMPAPGATVSGGPCYLVAPPVRCDVPVDVLRSDRPADAGLVRDLRPGNWEPEEWAELVAGGQGAPWSMVVSAGQVVSICHTPHRTAAGAEAGTWTAPGFRGRGYAAATTAAWADLLTPDCPRLFYSTTADNRSSQRVAERLGLRHIGWIWRYEGV